MRNKVLAYHQEHNFCPSFDLIFTGSKAVISIKHKGEGTNVGHQETNYGLFFWLKLSWSIKKCFYEQVKHKSLTEAQTIIKSK